MTPIASFLTEDHRACDALLAEAETAAQAGRWPETVAMLDRFAAAVRCHLDREEAILFPAFEQATGSRQGPTAVMRMEHEQVRAMLLQLDAAASSRDRGRFLGLAESLMVLVQQHNMKEEQILYPMCDQVLVDAKALTDRMAARKPDPA